MENQDLHELEMKILAIDGFSAGESTDPLARSSIFNAKTGTIELSFISVEKQEMRRAIRNECTHVLVSLLRLNGTGVRSGGALILSDAYQFITNNLHNISK